MEIKALNEITEVVAPDKSIIREWVAPGNSRAKKMSMAEITIPPGVKVPPHYHQVIEETYFILEGEGEMELGDEKRTMSAGEAVVILPNERHTIANKTDKPLKMYVTCVPAWTFEESVFVE
jgi:mannose-6-phosphate isomerase-like protein (cupin superfamily)|tara:strand:+ start:21556 stop:21918 length:363 start_codon:yes stop_codon:yes gene_type:complete